MKNQIKRFFLFLILMITLNLSKYAYCLSKPLSYYPFNEDQTINVVVEIPAGTIELWKLSQNQIIEKEIYEGKEKLVDYLPYPFNYGFVPQTLVTKAKGGDDHPLAVILLGPSIKRGSIVKAKPIGTLVYSNKNKVEIKIIALSINSLSLSKMNSIDDIEENYNGILDIIKIWIKNHKVEILNLKKILGKKGTSSYINEFHKDYLIKNKK